MNVYQSLVRFIPIKIKVYQQRLHFILGTAMEIWDFLYIIIRFLSLRWDMMANFMVFVDMELMKNNPQLYLLP